MYNHLATCSFAICALRTEFDEFRLRSSGRSCMLYAGKFQISHALLHGHTEYKLWHVC